MCANWNQRLCNSLLCVKPTRFVLMQHFARGLEQNTKLFAFL